VKHYSDKELAKILDRKLFHLIGDTADEVGLECYVVGGFVRDLFLQRQSNDIDVVTVGSGIALAEALKISWAGERTSLFSAISARHS